MLSMPRFHYLAPQSLEEAITMLTKQKGAKVIAGGTDLLVKMKKREIRNPALIGLKNIPYLDSIIDDGKLLKLGPLVTHQTAENSPLLNQYADFLAAACGDLGSYQIRCMGTLAGNICNASPSADSIPSLLVLQAQLRIFGPAGETTLPIDQFFQGPFETVLGREEILTSIEIPKPFPSSRGVYLKMSKVTEHDETLVGVAVLATQSSSNGIIEEIKIGLGSVAPTPIRAKRTETYLQGKDPADYQALRKAQELLMSEISPRSRSEYRRRITANLFEQALKVVLNKIL